MKEKIIKNKKKIVTIGSISIGILILLIILNSFSFSKLEKVKIEEVNNKISNYIDEVIEHKKDKGKYICYAIEYLYNTTDKTTFSYAEVLDEINNTFIVDYTEKDLDKIAISVEMANKGIVQDSNNKIYHYEPKLTQTDIANVPLVKYVPKITKKTSLGNYKVIYEKYVVEDPYKLLNYYDDYNLKHKKKINTKEIKEYLSGMNKIGKVKDFINKENIKKIGKISETQTITFSVSNNKVLIKKEG